MLPHNFSYKLEKKFKKKKKQDLNDKNNIIAKNDIIMIKKNEKINKMNLKKKNK